MGEPFNTIIWIVLLLASISLLTTGIYISLKKEIKKSPAPAYLLAVVFIYLTINPNATIGLEIFGNKVNLNTLQDEIKTAQNTVTQSDKTLAALREDIEALKATTNSLSRAQNNPGTNSGPNQPVTSTPNPSDNTPKGLVVSLDKLVVKDLQYDGKKPDVLILEVWESNNGQEKQLYDSEDANLALKFNQVGQSIDLNGIQKFSLSQEQIENPDYRFFFRLVIYYKGSFLSSNNQYAFGGDFPIVKVRDYNDVATFQYNSRTTKTYELYYNTK